jgi:hypothetical protein
MVFNWYPKNAGVGEGGQEAFTGYKIALLNSNRGAWMLSPTPLLCPVTVGTLYLRTCISKCSCCLNKVWNYFKTSGLKTACTENEKFQFNISFLLCQSSRLKRNVWGTGLVFPSSGRRLSKLSPIRRAFRILEEQITRK